MVSIRTAAVCGARDPREGRHGSSACSFTALRRAFPRSLLRPTALGR